MGGVDFEDYASQTVTAPEGAPLPNEYKIQQSNYFNPYGVNRTQSSSEVARIINEIAQKENVSPEQVLQVMKQRYGNK